MSAAHETVAHHHEETMTKKKIWGVFWVLTLITSVEFFIALYMVPHNLFTQGSANFVYIALTLLKAFYIVAFFMHLKFEKLGLVYSIVVPLIFIIGFIVAMMTEGTYTLFVR